MALSAYPGNTGDTIAEINTTPLIDVLLVLLVTLIMTLPPLSNITRLDSPGGGGALREVIYLDVDFDGTLAWNGTVVPSLDQLERWVRLESAKSMKPELRVRPDKRAPYDSVAKALAIAQRNGLENIGISSE
jgi:biopolymer transport protein ExbD